MKEEVFGVAGNDRAMLYTLENTNGVSVQITNYGGIVTNIITPDKNGIPGQIVLGFNKFEQYISEHPYFGAICGRFANRIANGNFSINGKEYTLAQNNNGNSLHGGLRGFDKVFWSAEDVEVGNAKGIRLKYSSTHLEEGYPGNLEVEVTYSLTDLNELIIDYKAETDQATHINLTNHCYFNLNGCTDNILNHELYLNADKITVFDDNAIPTGEIIPVSGTAFDFRESKKIGQDLSLLENGYDQNYVLNSSNIDVLAARVLDNSTGRALDCYTTEPGMQFYTGNYLDGSLNGHQGLEYKKHYGLCLEAQHFPDSPNHTTFPSTLLNPGQLYTQQTVYRFGLI